MRGAHGLTERPFFCISMRLCYAFNLAIFHRPIRPHEMWLSTAEREVVRPPQMGKGEVYAVSYVTL